MSAAALSHGLEKAELLVVEGIKAAGLGTKDDAPHVQFQKYPCLTSGPTLSLCAYRKRLRLQTPGQRPGGPKATSSQSTVNLKLRLILGSGLI